MLVFLNLSLNEYSRFVKKTNAEISIILLYILSNLFYLLTTCYILEFIQLKWILLFIPIVILAFLTELYRKKLNPLGNIAYLQLAIFYIAIPLALMNFLFYPDLNMARPRVDLLLGFFILIWINDTFAYLSGMMAGKKLLFKRISPKKTWEGSIGGGIFTLAGGYVLSLFYQSIDLNEWLGFALIIIIFGTFGDLVESMFKRSIDVKDSGNIMPGHGGILDRLDSLLISAPFLFVYLFFILN